MTETIKLADLTPSARTRISVDDGADEPSLAELLFRQVGND